MHAFKRLVGIMVRHTRRKAPSRKPCPGGRQAPKDLAFRHWTPIFRTNSPTSCLSAALCIIPHPRQQQHHFQSWAIASDQWLSFTACKGLGRRADFCFFLLGMASPIRPGCLGCFPQGTGIKPCTDKRYIEIPLGLIMSRKRFGRAQQCS